ncbi:hypothetical protein FNF31_07489 [Cafeteria roenbergensis]|uniref:Pre-mRNA polyadenylation factor Fip1 domain-containing protein n=1 Tax=Cafeteria roenbergensis TaxID=33653 RepID=A0A5A8C4X6_CAFRO|nr:hypothetical protein FNF31_07489 [Cafeteria roenbergensis]KAA0164365.1 hypothetical protein FNF28_03905 [Cafeteria roenbergensis]
MARGVRNRELGFTAKARLPEREATQARIDIARTNLANVPRGTEQHQVDDSQADISAACTEPRNPWGPYMRSDGAWVTRSGILLEPGTILPLPSKRTHFDIPLHEYSSHPWRAPDADRLSFFNFGLDEPGWEAYAASQRRTWAALSIGPAVQGSSPALQCTATPSAATAGEHLRLK